MVNYFKNKPLTLVHGDCRPGNMLFIDDGKLAFKIGNGDNYALSEWPKAVSLPKVIFSDWEATNAAPLFWDFTYCTILGLTIADRRMYQQPLLAEFQDTLQAHGVPKKLWENQASQAEVELLTLILGFLGFIIRKNGFWDKQGNTHEDVKAWHERIFTAVCDVDSKNVAHNLRIPEQLIIQLQNMPWLDLGVGKIKNET